MKSWMQVLGGVLLGDTPVRKCGSRSGQREKLIHNVVVTEASADPMGSSGAEMAPQSCPKLRLWNQTFASLSLWAPNRGCNLGWNSSLWLRAMCKWGMQLWAVSSSCSHQLGNEYIGLKSLSRAPLYPLLGVCNHICELLELSFYISLLLVAPRCREEKSRNGSQEREILARLLLCDLKYVT